MLVAALQAFVPDLETSDQNLNRLQMFQRCAPGSHDVRGGDFFSRIRDLKPNDTRSRGQSEPMRVGAVNSRFRLAKEKRHRLCVMGVFGAVEHIFNETAMHTRTPATNRCGKGKQSKSWSKRKRNRKSKRTKGAENPH